MLQFQDAMAPCKGEFHIDVLKGGRLIDEIHDHNLVVDVGRIRLAELAAGTKENKHITQIGLGSGSETEDASDIALTNQILLPLSNVTVTGRDVRFDFFIDTDEANGLKVHEFGGRVDEHFNCLIRVQVLGSGGLHSPGGGWRQGHQQ